MLRVLIVDDEPKLGRLLAEMLEVSGHTVERSLGGREALALLERGRYDLVVTDLRMPEVGGLEILARARRLEPPAAVIVMTAFGTAESAVEAMKAGAADYLLKPFSMDELRLRVQRVDGERAAESRTRELAERLAPTIVAESAAMKRVLTALHQVARTDATVLILGESGTGKSQLARALHYASSRRMGALVEVHCAALPDALLESELFGHEKGAFTGADQAKAGLLAGAEGGTLFLDEIGEIKAATQVKLLRFLQSREFVPIGSSKVRKIDARVVAATNRDLAGAVAAGSFREDLYYRLNVFPLMVPALRERPEDILPIAERTLASRGIPKTKLTEATRAWMSGQPWPGNVRALENALERAAILAGEDPITLEHLSFGARLLRVSSDGGTDGLPGLVARVMEHASSAGAAFDLDAFERALLYAAIERNGGNKSAAARALGITRRRLYSRLKSLSERLESDGVDTSD